MGEGVGVVDSNCERRKETGGWMKIWCHSEASSSTQVERRNDDVVGVV